MASVLNYIGQGIVFPIEVNAIGGVNVETGFKLLNSSIKAILLWPRNSRIFLSRYGSLISTLLEEPNDFLVGSLVQNYIVNTLSQWEKRIVVLDTSVISISAEQLQISITYRLTNTKIEETFVFPFYRNIIY